MPDKPPSDDEPTDPLSRGSLVSPSPFPPPWTTIPNPQEEGADVPECARYRPVSFHKRGGMGQVWRALDGELGREVAFKVIRPKFADDDTARRRFEFEAEVTGRLEHPAVIPVYGAGRDAAARPYYAMRFVEGKSLQEAIAAFHAPSGLTGAERVVALRRLLGHFVTVCRAVDFAHSRGVIHRDLKPDNVMVGEYGETLVVDWGIAKRLRAGAGEPDAAPPAADEPDTVPPDPNRSLRGSRLGSPGYWSPEQAAGRPDLHDERTDVYGLGSILFAILAGSPPHATGVPPPVALGPQARCPWVDAGIDAIARTAMAFAAPDRYPSAAALALAVERWLADQPVAAQRGAVAALARRADEHPNDFALAEQLARQRANLGLMLAGMGRDADALDEFRTAAAAFGRFAQARGKPRLFAEQANSLLSLARCYDALDRADEAKVARRDAAALYGRLIATRPDEYKQEHADIMLTWAGSPPPEAADPNPTFDQTFAPAAPPPTAPGPTTPPDGATRPAADRGSTAGDEWKTWPPAESPAALADTGMGGTDGPAREQRLELSGGYTLLSQLARGGMGVLYLARDNALNRQVVIKALHEHAAHDAATRGRFLNEMQITAALEHPNVVRVYTHGTRSDGTPFLVMEHLNGVTLLRMLDVQPPGWSRAMLDPLAQACDGLHYAHTRGIVHRDAKLSNVVVTPGGRSVVLDWGIAKVSGQPDAPAEGDAAEGQGLGEPMLTHDGAVMGTPAYMSPEQARGDARLVDRRADVYTLGADLFQLVSGRLPVVADGAMEILHRVAVGDIPRLRDVRPDVPPQLDAICTRAMAFRPEDRYPTADALGADIREFLTKPGRRWWRLWS